ncbi:hypothetical protein K1719_006677 [Acacia pycnantha]|nr:hypothetical protein K1719_006677 [Acacia pycnantha]
MCLFNCEGKGMCGVSVTTSLVVRSPLAKPPKNNVGLTPSALNSPLNQHKKNPQVKVVDQQPPMHNPLQEGHPRGVEEVEFLDLGSGSTRPLGVVYIILV